MPDIAPGASPRPLESVSGLVERVTFYSEDSGFGIKYFPAHPVGDGHCLSPPPVAGEGG